MALKDKKETYPHKAPVFGIARRKDGVKVFALTGDGVNIAEGIARSFKNTEILKPERLKNGGLVKEVEAAFKRNDRADCLVFVCAVGIAVRAVAPHIKGKAIDPAVVVIDDCGRFVVSLLSGHLGRANGFAAEFAAVLDATPVITTATDLRGLPSAEDIASRFNMAIENVAGIKTVNSAILRGDAVFVMDADAGRRVRLKKAFAGSKDVFRCFTGFPSGRPSGAYMLITSSASVVMPKGFRKRTLILRPREFVVGIGCKRGATAVEIERACMGAFSRSGLSPLSIRNLATIDVKRHEKGILDFAKKLKTGVQYFSAGELNSIVPPSGISKAALKNTGAFGVAEQAALLSSGAKGLWIKKEKTKGVTIAAALAR